MKTSTIIIPGNAGEVSDGHHTFNELYEFRVLYNAALFNEWAKHELYNVHKSFKHEDGENCLGLDAGTYFIVVATLPTGIISNHYKGVHWSKFRVPVVEKSLTPYDGHTAKDVATRLELFLQYYN